jgi:hypothetical protein
MHYLDTLRSTTTLGRVRLSSVFGGSHPPLDPPGRVSDGATSGHDAPPGITGLVKILAETDRGSGHGHPAGAKFCAGRHGAVLGCGTSKFGLETGRRPPHNSRRRLVHFLVSWQVWRASKGTNDRQSRSALRRGRAGKSTPEAGLGRNAIPGSWRSATGESGREAAGPSAEGNLAPRTVGLPFALGSAVRESSRGDGGATAHSSGALTAPPQQGRRGRGWLGSAARVTRTAIGRGSGTGPADHWRLPNDHQ